MKNGYSTRVGGHINHYDSSGKKTGESTPSFFGDEWTNRDASGKVVSRSYVHPDGSCTTYDTRGRVVSRSYESFGRTVTYDASGHRTGSSYDGFFGSSDSGDNSSVLRPVQQDPIPAPPPRNVSYSTPEPAEGGGDGCLLIVGVFAAVTFVLIFLGAIFH